MLERVCCLCVRLCLYMHSTKEPLNKLSNSEAPRSSRLLAAHSKDNIHTQMALITALDGGLDTKHLIRVIDKVGIVNTVGTRSTKQGNAGGVGAGDAQALVVARAVIRIVPVVALCAVDKRDVVVDLVAIDGVLKLRYLAREPADELCRQRHFETYTAGCGVASVMFSLAL